MMENNRGMMSFAIYLTSDIAEICDIDQKKDELCIRYQFENCIFPYKYIIILMCLCVCFSHLSAIT